MRKVLLLVPFLLFYLTPHAQVMYGPEVGGNAGIFKVSLSFLSASTTSDPGFLVGGVVDFPLAEHLDLRTGARFTSSNYTLFYSMFKLETKISTIQVPVNLEYALIAGEHSKLYVGAGPYVSLNTLAKQHVTLDTAIARRFGITNELDSVHSLNAADFGVTLKAGALFGGHFFTEAYFQKGFGYLALDVKELQIRNFMFGMTVGYLFGRGRERGFGGGYKFR